MNNTLRSWLARGAAAIATLAMIFSGAMPVLAVDDGPAPIIIMTGNLQVNKVTVGGDNTFSFTGSGSISPFDITTTGGAGSNQINGLSIGSYTITEGSLPTGWSETSNTCVDVSVTFDNTTTCTITNTYDPPIPTYTISGVVYNDNSPENGQYDEGEQGLEGWKVYVDLPVGEGDGNNDYDAEEAFDYSDENGSYTITGLPRGCYTVREELQGGWNETEPTSDQEYEYNDVCIGAELVTKADSIFDKAVSYLFKTAQAAVNYNAFGLDFGNVEKPRSGGSSGSRPKPDDSSTTTTNDDPGRVLGDSTTTPSQPTVLGATLPVTGTPIAAILLAMASLAVVVVSPKVLSIKKN